MIERRLIGEASPRLGAPFAAQTSREAEIVERLNRFVTPQQARN